VLTQPQLPPKYNRHPIGNSSAYYLSKTAYNMEPQT